MLRSHHHALQSIYEQRLCVGGCWNLRFCQCHSAYWVIQEVRSVFWEMIILIIARGKHSVNMCLILIGYWDRVLLISWHNSTRFFFFFFFFFFFCSWMESKVYKRKVDAQVELLARTSTLLPAWRNVKIVFAKNTRSSHKLVLTVGFSKTYCKL